MPSLATPQQIVIQTALDYSISTTTFSNLAFSESTFNPKAYSKNPPTKGCPQGSTDRGIFMINDCYHLEVSDECAYDVNCASQWMAGRFVDGFSSESVPCNCYAYLKTKIKDLPLMNKIVPNSSPSVGSVAIFSYNGLPHLALVTKISADTFSVQEANYKPCGFDSRDVLWTDVHLKGFWTPSASP